MMYYIRGSGGQYWDSFEDDIELAIAYYRTLIRDKGTNIQWATLEKFEDDDTYSCLIEFRRK